MNIAENGTPMRVIHGTDSDNNSSGVYIVHSEGSSYGLGYPSYTRVIAEREASLMSLLLSGRKLKPFSGGDLAVLFEKES